MRRTSKSARHWIAGFLWLLLMGIIGLVLFAYALPQDLTRTTRFYATLVEISFFARVLSFHFALLAAAIGVLAIVIGRKSLSLIAIAASFMLGYPTLIHLSPNDPPTAPGPAFRLMSMNLKYTYRDGDLIANQIRSVNPDVLVVEDYTPYSQSILIKQFGTDYPHRYLLPNNLQGLAIFSKLPFEGGKPKTTFNQIRRQMRSVVLFNGQPIVIYTEHPFSPRRRQRIINNRLSTVDLANQVRSEQLPVIVAGDFNFTEETPNEAVLKSIGLQDTFDLAGHGRGSTWPEQPRWLSWIPGFRIDHIFISSQLTCTRFSVGEYDGSDHLPIVADIAIRTGP